MADPKQAAQTTRTVNITDQNPSIGWGNAVEAAIDARAAELEASERSEPYVPAAKKPLPKVKPSVGPTSFPAKKPIDVKPVEPAELKVEEAKEEKPVEVKPRPIQPTDVPKPLPIDTWVSAGMRAALSSAQQRGSRVTSPEEAVAAARKRIDDMAKTEGRTFDDYAADAKRRGISLTSLVDDSAKQINERWALSQASTRQTGGMVRLPTPSGPTSVTFDVGAAEKAIKDKLYSEAKARGVDINSTQPKILTATELRTEATRKMSGETSGFMGNPATSEDKEVSKEGEVGAQTADLIIAELFSDDSDGTIGRYVQSLQNNPGGYAEWIKNRSIDLLKKRGINPSMPNFTEQERLTRAQAANEVFAMKTKGIWTAPIFVNRDLEPDTYFGALSPAIEVIGYGNEVVNGKPIVVQRQESTTAWLLNALDAPQYAAVGAAEALWDHLGKPNAPGESLYGHIKKGVIESTAGRRDIFKAVTESEGFQARQVYNPDGSLAVDEKGEPLTTENWRPWVYGSVGLAASVLFPDAGDLLIFPTVSKVAKGISSISEARRAEKGSEILTQIAASRTAAKASFEESLKLADEAAKATDPAVKAEKTAAATEARHQSDALFEAASSHERRLFAEQEGLAKHLDETDGDAHKQMKTQASIDSANVLLARTIVDRADALESVHPAMRKPLKSVQGASSKNIQVGRKDLYDTHSQLKRAEDSFRNAARLPDTQNAVLSFVSQPELARLKELLPESDFNEILAELPNAIQNPQQFVNLVAAKRANIQYPAGIGATTPSGLAFRQKVMSDGANIARKARDINSHVAAIERRVYDAILNNSESRAVAADTLANVLRKEGPRNIPSIDNVPDLGDPTLKLAEGDIDAKMSLTDGAKKLVSQLRSAGLTKKQSIALAAMMDTRARAWAWKTGEKVEDWYKVGNADRVSFVKEQAANIPTLQRGTADFLFEGAADFKRQDVVTAADELRIAAASGREFRENFIKLPVDKPMPLTDALKDIAKNDKREAFRLVAQRLTESSLMDSATLTIKSGPSVDVESAVRNAAKSGLPQFNGVDDVLKESNGAINYATASSGEAFSRGPRTGEVNITLPEVSGIADTPSLIIMHEAVHIATVKYVSPLLSMSPQEVAALPAETKQAVDRMRDIYKQTKKSLTDAGNAVALKQYGFTNVHEFVAEALSNPQFQDILKKIKVSSAEKSVWSYFVETVSNLLGINRGLSGNALVETIAAFDRILTATSGPSFIKAAGAAESIDKMENELIRLKRLVAQDPKRGIVYNDEIRQLEKSIAYSKREAAKAAKAAKAPVSDTSTAAPATAAIPVANVDEAKSALSEAIKAEDAAKLAYEDALIAKRANPKDAAAKAAVEDAKAKLREASANRVAAKKSANAEIRAANKASQAEMLEDPDLKQAYARVRAAEKNVVDTKNNLERAKLAYADAVRAKDSVAKRAAERDITTLEAALGVFEKSERETKDVYKRLADEYKAKKAAEAAAQDAAEEAKVVDNLDDKTTVDPIEAKPVENSGGLPVSVGPSSNIEEELLDLDRTGTATQVATGPGWPATNPNAGTKAATGAPTGAATPPTPPHILNPATPAPTAATGAPPVTPPPAPPGAPVFPSAPANLPKGAVAFYNDGRAIIYAFEKADFNTFVHEIGHVVRRDLIDEEREVMRAWLSVEAGKPVEIDLLGNFVDPSTGQLFSKADSDALEELFTDRFVDWMATSAKPSIKAASKPIDNVFEAVKSWMLDAYKTLKAVLPGAVSAPVDEFFTNVMFIGKDPSAVSDAFAAAKRVVAEKRGFIRGMIGPDVDSVDLYAFDELAKGAKAGGLNVTPAALERMIEKDGYIEFPRPVLGRTRYDAREIAALQKELEEMGTTELYRSKAKLIASDRAKSITEETPVDKWWNMLREEPLNYDTIADPTKPTNPVKAFVKSSLRAATALFIGADEMADLRHLPPAVRQTVLSGVRVISSVYHDALKLAEERDLPKLFSYLTGDNVKFHNGRRVMTASWDSVSSVQMRLKDIIEAGGASIGADIQVLVRAADFSNMAPEQAEAASRAVEFILNNTPSMFTKQLLQTLGAAQPLNKVYDPINTPKEMILAKALYNLAYAAPRSGIERFHGLVSKLYGEEAANKAMVLLAAHGQADRVRRTWFNAGIAISSTDANMFKAWLNGEYIPDSALPTIKRVADTLGLNPTFVPALDAIGKYDVPAAAYDRLTSALAKASPDKQHWLMKSENDTNGSSGPMAALQAWIRWRKTGMVRGSLMVRSRLLTSNSMDLILMAGNNLGLGVAMAASGRVAAQTALALAPGVTRAIDVASRMGWAKPGALETVRDAIQASGDKFAGHIAKMMWNKAMSLDVNKLLDGEKTVFNMGGKVYSWEDLRQIALEEGVFDSMPASLESAVRRSVRAPVTATEKVGDRLASYMEYVSDVQEGVAERERAGMMLTLMELGVNPRVAARMTVKTMFDYVTSVASGERSMLISLFEPFWPFLKNASRSLINNFFTGYGAYRIGLLRRASERSVDAINELIYDSIVDPYGVDVSALSDEGSDNYYEMRRIVEAKYGGVEKVPLNVKLSIGAVFAGQTSYFLHDGKLFYMKSRIGEIAAGTNNNNKLSPYLDRLGLPARLDTEDAVIPRPDRSSSSSFYRDLYAITLPVTMTKQTQRYMEMAAPDHPFIEFLMPETYVQTAVRRMGSLTALAVLGAYGLFDTATGFFNGSAPTTGEMEGLNWTRAGNITEQILDPERALLLPQAYSVLFDDDNSQPYRIHPIMAKALSTIGVSHLEVNAAQDPFAVTFDTSQPTSKEAVASAEAISKNQLPGESDEKLGASIKTTRHYLPAHWGLIIQSIPELDGFNKELLRYNDDIDLKPGSGPLERSASVGYAIAASAFRVVFGLSTAEPHRSKTALREEPRKDTTTTNPNK